MNAYLVIGLLLLVTMAYLVLHPFLVPHAVGEPPIVLPPVALTTATAAPEMETTAVVVEHPTDPPAVQPRARTAEELRADVELAIAARKAAMLRHSCPGCGASVDNADAFCRSCGTRVKE